MEKLINEIIKNNPEKKDDLVIAYKEILNFCSDSDYEYLFGDILEGEPTIENLTKLISYVNLLTEYNKVCRYFGLLNISRRIDKGYFKEIDGIPYISTRCLYINEGTEKICLPAISFLIVYGMESYKIVIRDCNAFYISIYGLSLLPDFDEKLKEIKKEKSNFPAQKTYLMLDVKRGFYKIGKSANPRHRESTLQAEVPSITIVHIIDINIEKELHNKFKSKRMRGEWFKLLPEDVEYIKSL